jgi:hypothetical protein
MTQTIFDRSGRRYRFSLVEADPLRLIQLYHQHTLVGEVKCICHSPTDLELKDIAIANEVSPTLGGWLQHLIKVSGWQPQPINYRRQGLGSALLSHLIDYARSQGFQSLWGEVFRPDVENTPGLLQWYQKHGFEVRPTTHEEKPDLIALLHMRLN